ncbi:MAG: C40 family peptidase [Bowdeniella nasicola]|nr:C40 family peptidase [Bowdeniella nasicola]
MTITTRRGRHAAKPSALKQLRDLSAAVTGGNRKGTVAAASSGIALTMVATAAGAATAPQPTLEAQADIDSTHISQAAKAALAAPVAVEVAKDAEWDAGTDVTVEGTKAPKPVVRAAAPAPARQQAASRSHGRQAPAASAARSQAQAAAPVPPPSAAASSVVQIAYRYIGTPYVAGGSSPAGFDCSGFTSYVYRQVGINLPRSSSAQRHAGRVVPASQARPGDLIWWPGHVGIYLGNGQHIAARNPRTPLAAGPIYRSNPTFIRVG